MRVLVMPGATTVSEYARETNKGKRFESISLKRSPYGCSKFHIIQRNIIIPT